MYVREKNGSDVCVQRVYMFVCECVHLCVNV